MPVEPERQGWEDVHDMQASVRRALVHMYDAEVLAEHPLVYLFGLQQRPDRARALRDRLIGMIRSLKPDAEEPAESPRWQTYQVLLQRYVRGVGAEALADQLSMSSRQLRRLQVEAIAQLCDAIVNEFGPLPGSAKLQPVGATPDESQPADQTVDEELAWLRATPFEAVNITGVLDEVIGLIEPVVIQTGVRIRVDEPAYPADVIANPSGLKQALLSAISYCLGRAGSGELRLRVDAEAEHVILTIVVHAKNAQPAGSGSRLALAKSILDILGGDLSELRTAGNRLELRIRMTRAGVLPVLVVDDNPDALALYERHAAGSRYRIEACQDPKQALGQALSLQPRLILLDIMMPGIDGWSLLGQIRNHPETQNIPVVACTIVPEERLALSLGAAAFLQKPVSRSAFLTALDQLTTASRESG